MLIALNPCLGHSALRDRATCFSHSFLLSSLLQPFLGLCWVCGHSVTSKLWILLLTSLIPIRMCLSLIPQCPTCVLRNPILTESDTPGRRLGLESGGCGLVPAGRTGHLSVTSDLVSQMEPEVWKEFPHYLSLLMRFSH